MIMNKLWRMTAVFLALLSVLLILTACDASTGGEVTSGAEGQEAFIDGVTVTEADGHYYATVNGHYPDACARISEVQQTVEGTEFTIRLFVASPDDLMCAQMLTPFVANILLETGGQSPGEYSVRANEAQPATFTIGG
jgi:hypothetical protein